VTIVAGMVGAFCGGLATIPYRIETIAGPPANPNLGTAGPVLGGAMGILTGVIWSRIMVRRACRHPGPLAGRGAILGLAAGVSSTVVLHLGLSVIGKGLPGIVSLFPATVLAGLLFGIPAGALVGGWSGNALEVARRRIGRAEPGTTLGETGSRA